MIPNVIEWLDDLQHRWGVPASEANSVAGMLEEIAASIYDLGLIYEAGGDIDGPLSSLEQLAKSIASADPRQENG